MSYEEALEVVINNLDEEMEKNPNRELASISNYLQAILDDLNGKA